VNLAIVSTGILLLHCAGKGHLHVVRRLLFAGVSTKSANDDGRTPRDIGVSLQELGVVAKIENWCRSKGTPKKA
jgi:hypothetical protein